jgi:hypothetical protein
MTELPEVLQEYRVYTAARSRFRASGKLELDIDFVFPTTLLPIAVLMARDNVPLVATNPSVQGYVDWITTAGGPVPGGTFLPIVKLSRRPEAGQMDLGRLQDLSTTTQLFAGNRQAYLYVLSEMVDNIYQHARSTHAFAMAQYYPARGVMELSFMDDGITIPKSLELGTGRPYLVDRASDAIYDALNGLSSKPGGERGYGLPTSVRMVNELGGDALVVSGRGCLVARPRLAPLLYTLRAVEELEGTLVTLRLPDSSKTINFYDFVEVKGTTG